ncbi:MAG: hypothetical protein ACHQCI_00955 [Solirubrobacterales bacterium]|jgi:Ca2+-binding RTX toxin-like protein
MALIGGLSVLTTLVLAGAARGGPPPPTTSCGYDSGAKELTITATASGFVLVSRDGDEIVMSDNLGPIACAGSTPTVNNVDHVTATETGDKELVDFAIEAPGVFQPGATDAGDTGVFNPNEIEWTVDLGNGYDVLSYYGAGDPDGARITYGTLGVNHNVSDNTLANDLDVEITGVNAFRFDGGNDDDGVSGAGTQGTGNPTKLPFEYFDYPGGGIYGAGGNDYLVGGRGDDLINAHGNADYVSGGKGEDVASWAGATDPVEVDIDGDQGDDGGLIDSSNVAPFTARDTVADDIENLIGGDDDDILRGSSAANVLTGGLGQDQLFGKGGVDLLKANDLIEDLKLNCGPGDDRKAKRDPGLDPKAKSC